MVTALDGKKVRIQEPAGPPILVEFIGLAGAGKTTLSQALSQCGQGIRVAPDLALRNREHIPIVTGHIPHLAPFFLHRCRSSRWFTWDELKALLYLETWPQLLTRQAKQRDTAILLDHGPIFKLATLDAFGPDRLRGHVFEPWWASVFERCVSTMDIVVWLHAPENILIERINARRQRHAVKGKTEIEAQQFLRRYQESYERILTKLMACGRLRLLQYNTDQTPIGQIVDELLFCFAAHDR